MTDLDKVFRQNVRLLARITEVESLLKTSFDIEAPENAAYTTYEEWVKALKEYQRGKGCDYERRGKSSQ